MRTEMKRFDIKHRNVDDDGEYDDKNDHVAKTCQTADRSRTPSSRPTRNRMDIGASTNVVQAPCRLVHSLAASGSAEGVDISLADDQDNTVVHWAARLGCCVSIQPALTTALACASNEFGVTQLHEAADRGHPGDVEVLIAAGATLTVDEDGWTPLHAAAASTTADWKVVRLLVETAKDGTWLNAKTSGGQNTALHLAASNKMTSPARLIGELRSLDPTVLNSRGDTPFHSAARCRNPDSIIAMLDTFPPWSIDKEDFEPRVMTDLLTICAQRGNATAVDSLIRRGADLETSEVLRIVVDESIRCSTVSESGALLHVYQTIVDRAVLWRCRRIGTKLPHSDSAQFQEQLRRTVLYLLTKPSASDGRSVLEHVIRVGANKLLCAIFETPGVLRFEKLSPTGSEDSRQFVTYDVTDMTPFSQMRQPKADADDKGDCSRRFRPKHSYLEDILSNSLVWREKGIINVEPFRHLTKPLLNFSKLFYFLFGVFQLAFMCTFSVFYMPDWTSDVRINGTQTAGHTDGSEESAKWAWLIWPTIVLLYNVYMYFMSLSSELAYTCYLIRYKLCKKHRAKPKHTDEEPTRVFLATFDRLPACAYPVAVFIWFFAYSGRPGIGDSHYFEVLSVIFLFGWIKTFMLFSVISKHIYIFSLVLKEIIVKDIINSFVAVFVFTVLAFSSALYVLRSPTDNSTVREDIRLSAEINAYEVFASGLTMSEYIDYTIDSPSSADGRRFYRLIFVVYVCFTALLLVNLLIAMMTHRYDRAKRSAECTWWFNGVDFGLRIVKFFFAIFRALCRCCGCDGRAFISNCYTDADEPGRYLLDVQVRNAPTAGDTEQSRLLDEIAELSSKLARVAEKVEHLRD